MTYILGINSAYHESSACLIKDGKIVAAVEEERFNRVKHAKPAKVDNPDELPVNAIDFCLKKAGISLKDVDYIGFSLNPTKRLQNISITYEFTEGDWGSKTGEELFYNKLSNIPKKLSEIAGEDVSSKFIWLNHHFCHAGSTFLVSPFNESAILAVDGIGEITTTYLGYGRASKIKRIREIDYPNSLGFLWEKICKFLGFSEYDACKIMGLASYGDPSKYHGAFRKFVVPREYGHFSVDSGTLMPRKEDYTKLEKLFGRRRLLAERLEQRHADIAAALQQVTEEILVLLANYLHKQTGSENLCLAGGVALNCVSNSKLIEKTKFKNIYIQPASHDAGTALGAAYFIWNTILGNPRSFIMEHAFLGPEYSNSKIRKVLEKNNLKFTEHKDISKVAAKLISERNIVGWFQGKLEFGPRALGNRSILADPRYEKIKDILNEKVKHRESFRPFAPSVLAEKSGDWFKSTNSSLSTDFMLFAHEVRKDVRRIIPAVTHIDGTSRIQTVRKEINPRFHQLIDEFERITDVPIVLNTSFNDSEPIVCNPQDAVNTFLKTKIDYLAIGDFLVSRGEDNGN